MVRQPEQQKRIIRPNLMACLHSVSCPAGKVEIAPEQHQVIVRPATKTMMPGTNQIENGTLRIQGEAEREPTVHRRPGDAVSPL
ncbi:MAG: hypothetical protein KDA77_18560 [Planctomycetaceae bacterium]|nr:hypothetical protein [Planctomycetaceae bacterium]